MGTDDIDNETLTEISGFRLRQTCSACPEQYDVYDHDGNQVARLRLRNGAFRAEVGGMGIYEAYPRGDGMFHDDNERLIHLTRAVDAIQSHLVNCVQPDFQ